MIKNNFFYFHINILNSSGADIRKVSQAAEFYKENRESIKNLLCWNSLDAVLTVASNFGFQNTIKRKEGPDLNLLFEKNKIQIPKSGILAFL